MSKSFANYKKGIITIEIQSLMPERFVNLLWNKEVYIKNIKKINITTMQMDINLSDYHHVEDAAKRTNAKVKIINKRGFSFLLLTFKKKVTLLGGLFLFLGILYYLSTFIWSIDITSDKYLSPYEIRQQLTNMGVKPGTGKNKINVYAIEEKMKRDNENIMWLRARIEGSKIKISLAERHTPPNIVTDDSICNVVAKMDGQVIRIYTTAGTPIVKPGDIVKKGQIVIKGEQGKEGSTYPTHAAGDVIAKTFYEDKAKVKLKGTKKTKTGNKKENIYIELWGKRLYLRKNNSKFSSYEKVEGSGNFIKKVIYYELKEEYFEFPEEKVIEETVKGMENKLQKDLDKSARIIDKIVNREVLGDDVNLKVVFVIEQNISIKQPIE